MLFLLRKIRKALLTNLTAAKAGKRFTTYLLYAVGEILLVVIGILIAVSIDDWNEERKLKEKEQIYYLKLLEDIKQDEEQVRRLIQETDFRIQHTNQLLYLLQKETINPKEVVKEMMDAVSLVTYTFKPSTAAFDDLKSSGNLGLLNDEIAKSLRDYYGNIEGIVDVVDINADQAVRLFSETESYAKIGWTLIDFVDEAIDENRVDKTRLNQLIQTDSSYKKEIISDAIYFISSGARVKMLYKALLIDIQKMQLILSKESQQNH